MGKFVDLTGSKFGRLSVLNRAPNKGKTTIWHCVCDCGTNTSVAAGKLTRGDTLSCGCLQKQRASETSLRDLTGQRFGRLLVIERANSTRVKWLCRCDCGKSKTIAASSLTCSVTRSCGCLSIETVKARATHSMCYTSEYEAWEGMKSRCYTESDDSFQHYGARGIKVCDRWLEAFQNFFDDMGLKPSPSHSLERLRIEDGYNPDNCVWGTPIDQANNKSTSVHLEYKGRSQTVKQWCRELNMDYKTVIARVSQYGWPAERALGTPTNSGFEEKAKYINENEAHRKA